MNFTLPPNGRALAPFKDPFKTECFEKAAIFIYKGSCSGRIEFVNGNTVAEQKFSAKDFETVVAKMKAFAENLKSYEQHS